MQVQKDVMLLELKMLAESCAQIPQKSVRVEALPIGSQTLTH